MVFDFISVVGFIIKVRLYNFLMLKLSMCMFQNQARIPGTQVEFNPVLHSAEAVM